MAFASYTRSHGRYRAIAMLGSASGGAPSDPLGAGNTQLISDLGVTPLGFWDVRKNVTVSAGTVSQWDDCRGAAGFGPSLTAALSTQQPAWDATNLLINFVAASANNLQNASVSGWNLAAGLSVVVVAASATATVGAIFAEVASSASNYLRLLTRSTATGFGVNARDTVASVSTAAVTGVFGSSTTRRLLLGRTAGNAGAFAAEAPTSAAQTAANTGTFAAPTAFNVGRSMGAGQLIDMSLRAVLVLPAAYTTGQRDTLKSWSQTYHGVTLL